MDRIRAHYERKLKIGRIRSNELVRLSRECQREDAAAKKSAQQPTRTKDAIIQERITIHLIV